MSITREYFAKQLAVPLKAAGFKKVGSTWRRDSRDGVHVVNAQASQWGPDFFINIGFYIRTLGNEQAPLENHCHVRERLEHIGKSAEQVAATANQWFQSFGSMEQLAQHARADTLPLIISARALELARAA